MSDLGLESSGLWKAWILVCVAEASRMGAAPLATTNLHVLLYLANTLSDLYGVARVRGRVLKKGRFPFFPDVQREVDRLAFAGVISIEKVEFGPKGFLAAHYSIANKGKDIYSSLLACSKETQRTSKLFGELVSACFGRFLGERGDIGPIDANYGSVSYLEGEVVDFSEWKEENRNMEVAKYLVSRLSELRPFLDRDGVRLYCDYLGNAMEIV